MREHDDQYLDTMTITGFLYYSFTVNVISYMIQNQDTVPVNLLILYLISVYHKQQTQNVNSCRLTLTAANVHILIHL